MNKNNKIIILIIYKSNFLILLFYFLSRTIFKTTIEEFLDYMLDRIENPPVMTELIRII